MQNNINSNENYLFDTLNMILIPQMDLDEGFSNRILFNLEELEGDSVSFLHENYYNIFFEKDSNICTQIDDIRESLIAIEGSFWNIKDFIFHPDWVGLRNKTINLILEIEAYQSK
jgi:hypothetical protein